MSDAIKMEIPKLKESSNGLWWLWHGGRWTPVLLAHRKEGREDIVEVLLLMSCIFLTFRKACPLENETWGGRVLNPEAVMALHSELERLKSELAESQRAFNSVYDAFKPML